MNCNVCKKELGPDYVLTNTGWLCPECADRPRHRYYYINRPPGIGCQPKGFVNREAWTPGKNVGLIGRGERLWNILGWVEYLEPLAPEQVWKFELWPSNAAEVYDYMDWREAEQR